MTHAEEKPSGTAGEQGTEMTQDVFSRVWLGGSQQAQQVEKIMSGRGPG